MNRKERREREKQKRIAGRVYLADVRRPISPEQRTLRVVDETILLQNNVPSYLKKIVSSNL